MLDVGYGGLGHKRPLIEEVPVNPVGKGHAIVFIIYGQLFVEPGLIEKCPLGALGRKVENAVIPGEHYVFRVVLKPLETVRVDPIVDAPGIIRRTSARSVTFPGKVIYEHEIDEIVHVQQFGEGRIFRTVGIQPLRLEIDRVVFKARLRQVVQLPISLHIAVCGYHGSRPTVGILYNVVVLPVAAQVGCPVGGLGTLLGLEKAPVLAVDIEVIIATPRIGLSHGPLGVTAKDILDHDVARVAILGPGIVLAGAQVNFIEFIGTFVFKERILEFALTIARPEKKAKGVLGILATATDTSADAQAGVNLESFAAVGIDKLYRGWTFPFLAVFQGIDINTRRGIEQIIQVCHQRNRRDRQQRIVYQIRVG
ncbi:hypothetical protein ES703_89920 [subsurface metagenome]